MGMTYGQLYARWDQFNDWGGRGCNLFVPVLGGNGTKIAPTAPLPGTYLTNPLVKCDEFGQACRPCIMGSCRLIPGRGCFGDLSGDEIVVSRPPQSLNPSVDDCSRDVLQAAHR